MTSISELAPGLTQIKTSLETDELRAEIQSLTERLDRTRRHLKAEKAHSKRLRRRLDQINNNNENPQKDNTMTTNETTIEPTATPQDATPAEDMTPNERTAEGLAHHFSQAYKLSTELTLELAKLREYASAAYATLSLKEGTADND
ncbi:hypothetical protein COO72_12150 [Bifidobacterium callitrichos]|nr:hypothetical protein COO72_12150 [Bifidobacterium callitrichos]